MSEGQPTRPAEVMGIQEQDYLDWLHNPVTKMFMQHLRDRREDLRQGVLDRWQAGLLQLSTEHEIKGRTAALEEATTLPFQSIVTFYDELKQLDQAEEKQPQ